MPSVVTKGVKLSSFADDSKICKIIVSIIDCICLQMVLSQVSFRSDLWQLTLNCEKSFVLHLGNANPRYIYIIEGRPLSAPYCVRDFGATMSKNLFFHDHIKQIIANFRRKLFIVRKCFHYIDEFTLKTLCLTYLRPTIEYESALWAPHSKSEIDNLQSLQDKALSLCRSGLKISKISVFVMISLGTLAYFAKLDATNLFNVNMRNYHRGHKLSLNTLIIRTSVFKYALPQRRILKWNALLNSIVCSSSVREFKWLLL